MTEYNKLLEDRVISLEEEIVKVYSNNRELEDKHTYFYNTTVNREFIIRINNKLFDSLHNPIYSFCGKFTLYCHYEEMDYYIVVKYIQNIMNPQLYQFEEGEGFIFTYQTTYPTANGWSLEFVYTDNKWICNKLIIRNSNRVTFKGIKKTVTPEDIEAYVHNKCMRGKDE